jgi:hypothetical protein
MMNQQQPDKFFREKLQHYQKPAPQGAWNRIETALEKKTAPKFVWWKIAAVFFLVAGAAYLLWFNDTSSNQPPLARAEDRATDIPEKPEEIEPKKPGEDKMTGGIEKNNLETTRPPQSVIVVPQSTKEEAKNLTATKRKSTVAEEPGIATQVPSHETVSPTVSRLETPITKSTITLTFSSEETSQYLNKNALAEATSNEKKPSSLKKFLKKANDLKSNQDPFGDLRERKNEILALNFKNDKRGQNK